MYQYLRMPSGGARLAVGYITTGILMIIWTAVWLTYLHQHGGEPSYQYYICTGLILSGTALVIIGVLMGRIGSEAKNADAASPAAIPTVDSTTPANVGVPMQPMMQSAVPQPAAQPVVMQGVPANGAQTPHTVVR